MPALTLKEVREGLERGKSSSASPVEPPKAMGVKDFVSKEEIQELHDRHFEQRANQRKLFDDIDSLVGEIIGRFGWETYQKWNEGEIDSDWMARILNAERAREKAALAEVESVVYASVVSTLSKHPRKTLENVKKILEQNNKIIKGEKIL